MVYTEIISGLWISNIDMIYNKQFLKDNDITIIINCTINYKFNNESTIKNVRIPLVEDLYSNIDILKNNKEKILSYINNNLCENNILISCYDGKNISPFIIALYLIKYGDISKDNIKQVIRSKNINLSLDFGIELLDL